jgi:anti-sigma regulatory factor (Ser/Thr protein kinase)
MDERPWRCRALPDLGGAPSVIWAAAPASVAELSAARARLRGAVHRAARPAGTDSDAVDRLLLAFEELGSNGLRHGRPPVEMTVTTTPAGWLLDVTDAAVDRPPTPAVGRDPALGGLGLYLIARLAGGHGWHVRDGRKHVWACIESGAGRTAS